MLDDLPVSYELAHGLRRFVPFVHQVGMQIALEGLRLGTLNWFLYVHLQQKCIISSGNRLLLLAGRFQHISQKVHRDVSIINTWEDKTSNTGIPVKMIPAVTVEVVRIATFTAHYEDSS